MRPMSPPAPGRVLLAASLGFFVVILDVTIVNVALPSIGDDLGADLSELQWVVDAYVVAFAALLLSAGAFGDRIGVARCYSAGMVAFTLASIVCGAAPSLEVLLVARFLQGAAAALLLPSSLALVRLAYLDPGARAKAIGIWAAMGGVALAAGPVVGGLLTGAVDWRAIFFLNIPVGIAAVVANARSPRSARIRTPLDLPGQIAAVLAIGALTYGVIEAGHEGIDSPRALAAFVVFALAAEAFLVIERRSSHPAVPLGLFRAPIASAAIVTGLLFNFAFYGQVFVLSLYFQDVLGHGPIASGLMFLPLTGHDRRGQRLVGGARQPPRAATAADRRPAADDRRPAGDAGARRRHADRPDPAAADPARRRRRTRDAAADRGAARGAAARSGRRSPAASSTPRASSAAGSGWRCSAA